VKSATYQHREGNTLVGPPYFVALIEELEMLGNDSASSAETALPAQ